MNGLELLAGVSRVGLAVIFNSLWQGALIAGVAWLILRIFTRANATTRYAVWSLTLLAMLIVPFVTSLSRVSIERQTPVVSTASPANPLVVSAARMAPSTPAKRVDAAPSTPSSSLAFHPAFHVQVPLVVSAVLFGLWLLGALVVLVRLAVGLTQLERLKSDSLPLDVAYRDSMPRWNTALKGERDVRICISEHVEVPVAVGLFDSMILLPAHLVHSLDPAEIDQISLHELGHLLRGDDWTNALQRVAAGLMFFNPAAWFVSRQMDVEREVACDDYVLESTGAVRPYAFCLTKMAEMTAWPHNPVAAPGVFVTRKNISIRIERLLRSGRAIGSSIAPSIAGAVTVALVAVFFVLRTMTPSIAFTVPAVPAAPAAPAVRHVAAKVAKPPLPVARLETKATPAVEVAAVPTASAKPQTRTMPTFAATPAMPAVASTVRVAIAASTKGMVASNGSCTGCDFANANLNGRDFSNRSLEGTNFRGANLQNARFDRAQLTGSNFEAADLRNASFLNADLEGCNLRGARLNGARFDGATLTGCNIDISNLSPEQARVFLTHCEGCDFAHANLRGMDLHGIHLTGANMRGADLRNANLSGASFEGVNLAGALLSGANLNGADFSGCNFDRVDLRGVDLSKTNITGSSMANAIWR